MLSIYIFLLQDYKVFKTNYACTFFVKISKKLFLKWSCFFPNVTHFFVKISKIFIFKMVLLFSECKKRVCLKFCKNKFILTLVIFKGFTNNDVKKFARQNQVTPVCVDLVVTCTRSLNLHGVEQ
jgi:hypothetical protein